MNTLTTVEKVIIGLLLTGLTVVGIVVSLNIAGNDIGGTYLSSCCLASLLVGIGIGWALVKIFTR